MKVTEESLPRADRQSLEEVRQYMKWSGPKAAPKETRFLAIQWLEGLITMAEGRRIEEDFLILLRARE
jgi:hypothetical protein